MTAPSSGPLAGLRVVELAGLGPAPFAAMLLADLGAEVIRVERPGGSSPLGAGDPLNRSRLSLAVDLKHPQGPAVVRRLTGTADVLIEGFRPGVLERLGLGPQVLRADNPRLIYARMTGWGQQGPLADRAGHDITYAALSGALHLCGPADKPLPPANLLADFGGGSLYLVVGVLAALHARATSGQGQVVDAAMVDGAASLATLIYGMYAAGQWRDERGVNLLDGGVPYYECYRCADGGWVAVGALEPQFWAELNDILGVSFDLPQNDPAGFAHQRETYTEVFARRTRAEWTEIFAGSDACVAPVLSLAEAPSHPHALARGAFTDAAGPVLPAPAPRFSDTPTVTPRPARDPGADSRAVLAAAGFGAAESEALIAAGVVHDAGSAREPGTGAAQGTPT